MESAQRYWYAARRNRWSYRRPLTWEGWVVDGVWAITFVGMSPYVQQGEHPLQSLGLVFGLIAIFMAVRSWKGEPQRWND